MADASQQPSDRRLAVEAQRGEGASRFPFLLTDDLRSPLDDLQRLRDAEVKTREIIQKYQAAMREMMVRFEILDQDLNLKKHRNPIHHLESRIKKPASIFEKLERYGKEPTLENLERYIMDVAGVRVICSYIHDVYNLLELLQKQDDLEIVEIKDYINNPKLNGYRSLHVIVRIPVYFLDKKELIPVEVQLRHRHGLLGQLGTRSEVQVGERGAGDRLLRRAQGLQPHHRGRGSPHADPRSRVGDGRLAAGASCMG